jgi:hypothetical protein
MVRKPSAIDTSLVFLPTHGAHRRVRTTALEVDREYSSSPCTRKTRENRTSAKGRIDEGMAHFAFAVAKRSSPTKWSVCAVKWSPLDVDCKRTRARRCGKQSSSHGNNSSEERKQKRKERSSTYRRRIRGSRGREAFAPPLTEAGSLPTEDCRNLQLDVNIGGYLVVSKSGEERATRRYNTVLARHGHREQAVRSKAQKRWRSDPSCVVRVLGLSGLLQQRDPREDDVTPSKNPILDRNKSEFLSGVQSQRNPKQETIIPPTTYFH